MKVYAAIDLRGGGAVQLVAGDPGDERIRLPDPCEVARAWLDAGFRHLHVVDLDAAFGDGGNRNAIGDIATIARGRASLQVGGGLRDEAAIEAALAAGADRVIVGTRAVEDRPWLEDVARRFPRQVVVAADVRGDAITTRGWTAMAGDAVAFVAALDDLPLAAILVTDVSREGRQEGIDEERFRSIAGATRHPLIAAGGITDSSDLDALERAGAAGAVLGMALYSGRLEPAAALEYEETE